MSRRSLHELPEDLPEFLTGQLPVVEPEPEPAEREFDERDLEVLAALVDLGVPEDAAREAILRDRVALELSRTLLDEEGLYTLDELAEMVEVEASVLLQLRTAQGLPTQERYSALDLKWATQVATMLEVFNLETLVRSGRARANSIASIVMNDLGVVRDELILPLRRAGADDVTIGIALAEAMNAVEPTARATLETAYELQLRHMLSTELAASAARGTAQQLRVAVGFVDIVGFTRLSARIDPGGLDELIDAFEGRVVEVVSQRHDVAVVKYLGDAVMMIGPDVCTLAEAMLDLVREVDELVDAPIRGGLAEGEVLVRDGDYFGPAVNLAARLTDLTRPWRLLVAEGDVEAARRRFKVDRIRPVRLRGIGSVRPGVVQRELTEEELAEVAEREARDAATATAADSSD